MALINDKNHELSVAFFSNLLFPQSQFDREIILDSLDLCTAGPKKKSFFIRRVPKLKDKKTLMKGQQELLGGSPFQDRGALTFTFHACIMNCRTKNIKLIVCRVQNCK